MPEPQHRIERSQLVPLPVGDAFAFFADAYNLEALTPPWLGFSILTPRPIPMRKGTTIEYVLTTHRVPVRWRTEIVEWEPGRRFVDRQSKGPFRVWEHAHDFEERPDGTRIRDTVLYRMPYGPLGAIAHRGPGRTRSRAGLRLPARRGRAAARRADELARACRVRRLIHRHPP